MGTLLAQAPALFCILGAPSRANPGMDASHWYAPSILFLPAAAPRPAQARSRPGTGYRPLEITPEPPQTTGAAPTARFRPGADRLQTAQSPPSPCDETVPVANPR